MTLPTSSLVRSCPYRSPCRISTNLIQKAFDDPLSDTARQRLISQVEAERPTNYLDALHPLVNTNYTPTFPPLIAAEHDRMTADLPKETGIDLSRYEADALEPPARTFPDSDEQRPELLAAWRSALDRAYTSSSYLAGRNANLALLETYGKNAWLVGNWGAESELDRLEAELKNVKTAAETVTAERNARQEGAKAEMLVLEESWRKGVSGIVEVQVATEDLRREVLETRSKVAGN